MLYEVITEANVIYELVGYNRSDDTSIPTGNHGVLSGGQLIFNIAVDRDTSFYVQAMKNNPTTLCGPSYMNDTLDVVMNPLPIDKNLNVIPGTDCDNGTLITVKDIQDGIRYVIVSMATDEIVPGYDIIANTSLGNVV